MPDNILNNGEQFTGRAQPLPLQELFTRLKLNGFLVTPAQIVDANRIIGRYASEVKNESEISHYLSPVFARNDEEQLQFEEIFNDCFNPHEAEPAKKNLPLPKKSWWKYAIAILVAAVVIYFLILWILLYFGMIPFFTDPHNHPFISLYDRNDSAKAKEGKNPFQLYVNQKLEVYPVTQSNTGDWSSELTLSTKYNWGDKVSVDSISSHTYKVPGKYKLTAYVQVYYKNALQYIDTLTETVHVCQYNSSLAIINPQRTDSVKAGEKFLLEARITGEQPDSIRWQTDGNILGYGKKLETQFETEGEQQVICLAIYDSISSPCTLQQKVNLHVYEPNKPIISASFTQSQNAKPISIKAKVKPFWFYLTSILSVVSLVSFIYMSLLHGRRARKKKDKGKIKDEDFNKLLFSFSGKKQPAELPFQNKNYLPVPEPEINEAATHMRRRINNDAYFLQLEKTVDYAIRNRGFFQPVYEPRSQQSEYLILIDASHNNNQQVKLFEFLIEILKKQNVFVEKYYYRYEPNLCYNLQEPAGISLEKLSEKYSKNILLIFGNAYQLLYQFYPVFNNEYLQLLNRWQYKAVITPVTYSDWTNKETQALLPQITVIPVDVPGQLMLMDMLFSENNDVVAALKQNQQSFYKVAGVEFEDVNELKKYCRQAGWANITVDGKDVNILFQWIAALCIYPKIKWEITIAIGKAILDHYDKTSALNFTNLLRIARIKWMKDGQCPDYTRLDLLKELTEENEVIARKTILSLLKEIPDDEVPEKHFAYEEKEVQRISNEFILYAYDPVKYAEYESSRNLYERLYQENKIKDTPSKIYLKNERSGWGTLISKTGTATEQRTVPLEEYFVPDKKEKELKDKILLSLIIISSMIFFISLLGLIGLIILNVVNTNRFSSFTYKPVAAKNIRFNLINKTSIDSNNIILTVNSISNNGSWGLLSIPVTDSLKSLSVKTTDRQIYDTALQLRYDAYDLVIRADTITRNRQTVVKLVLVAACSADPANIPRIIHEVDSSWQVRDSLPAGPEPPTYACSYLVSYGTNVGTKQVEALIGNFNRNKIEMKMAVGSQVLPVRSNEIVIYPTGMADGISRTNVFIQYNNTQTVSKVKQLMSCLNSNAYYVPGLEYQSASRNFYRNEIRYFNKGFADSIAGIQNCLRFIYPGRTFYPLLVQAKSRGASVEVWVYDSVKANTKSKNPEQSYSKSNGKSVTISSGQKVTTDFNSNGRIGLFLKNSNGEIFGICSAPIFPSQNTAAKYVFAITEGAKTGDTIGEIYKQSANNLLIGLVRIASKSNVEPVNQVAGRPIAGMRNVEVGQEAFLYDPLSSATQVASSKGVITKVNYSVTITLDKRTATIKNAFSCQMTMNPGLSGSVLLDKDNNALGILVGGSATEAIFVPVADILKEFNMELLSGNRGAETTAY